MTTEHPRSDIALMRLVALRLADNPCATPLDAVTHLSCVQAQDLPGALTSVALRTAGRSLDEVRASIDAGTLVRSWPMRGTLHLLRADDLPWVLSLTGERMIAQAAGRRAELGLDEAALARAHDIAVGALQERPRSRAEMLDLWTAEGVCVDSGRGYHLLAHLALRSVIHQGALAGKEQLFTLSAGTLPAARRTGERAQLVAAWLVDYVRGHGPVTLADFARWTGLTMGDIRAGAEIAAASLATIRCEGVDLLVEPGLPDALETHRTAALRTLLLPGFDEYVLGYKDRTAQLDATHERLVCPGNNGVFRPTVVSGGRVVGTWKKRTTRAKGVEATGFAPLSATRQRQVERAAAALPA